MSATELVRSNSLAYLAARIQQEHKAAVSAVKRGCEHAIAAGKLLIEAKGLVEHGRRLAWLREHCQVSARTAQTYSRSVLEDYAQRILALLMSSRTERWTSL